MRRRVVMLGAAMALLGCDAGMGSNDDLSSTGGGDTTTGGQDTSTGGQDTTTGGQDTTTGGEDTTTGGEDTTVGPPDGATLFAQRCSACHGADGRGTSIGPTIVFATPGYLKHVVRSGRDEMSEFSIPMTAFDAASLPDADLDAIVEFLWSGTRPTDGATAFVVYCANCHGQDAKGGRVGEGIRSKATSEPGEYFEIVREGHGGTNYGARTSYMPAWTTAAIPNATIQAIVDHVKTL